MKEKENGVIFDEQRASTHDKRITALAPMRDALHLFIRMVLSELPVDARILCVGIGTGPELVYLAQAFPQWQFTAVEPAVPMLDVCRQRAEACGVASRCIFHEGYLETLPESDPFDAATSILVSQFMMDSDDRQNYFHQVAGRLHPGGFLVNADLASNKDDSIYKNLLDVWARTMMYAGVPSEEVEMLGKGVAVLAPREIE